MAVYPIGGVVPIIIHKLYAVCRYQNANLGMVLGSMVCRVV